MNSKITKHLNLLMDHNLLTNCDIPRSDSLQLFEEIKTNCMSFLLKPLGTLTDIIHSSSRFDPQFSVFNCYAPEASVKLGLGIRLFIGMLEKLGSDRHKQLLSDIKEGKVRSILISCIK